MARGFCESPMEDFKIHIVSGTTEANEGVYDINNLAVDGYIPVACGIISNNIANIMCYIAKTGKYYLVFKYYALQIDVPSGASRLVPNPVNNMTFTAIVVCAKNPNAS